MFVIFFMFLLLFSALTMFVFVVALLIESP